jgi:hypothetical protein
MILNYELCFAFLERFVSIQGPVFTGPVFLKTPTGFIVFPTFYEATYKY